MKISEIYKKYNIMPNLQEHMLRVSGVSYLISENINKKLDKESVVSATLLHDLGNMAKIKLSAFPKFAEPFGIKYWEEVLNNFKTKYGDDDYKATYQILSELKIPQKIYDLIQSLEFAKSPLTAQDKSFETKICLYSDARVAPHGVVPLKNRIDEVKKRYMKNKGINEEKFNQIAESLYLIEEQIFSFCTIKPSDITEIKVKPLIAGLIKFNIKTG